MVSHDVIAQLRQDITTAEDAGDSSTADRLRRDLLAAERADAEGAAQPDLSGTGTAPQPPPAIDADGVSGRHTPDTPGPGAAEQEAGIATDVPGSSAPGNP